MLERCKVGQLTIRGFHEVEPGFFKKLVDSAYDKLFEKPRNKTLAFPKKINLTAIEVGDWGVDAEREAAALLKASAPFDARVYLDLENRLSRQGLPHLADDVYLAMVSKNSSALQSSGPGGWIHRFGSFVNWVLTRNGTSLFRVAGWFILTIVLTAYPLSLSINVEQAEKDSHYTDQLLASEWNGWKALGLAFSYAVPIYRGTPDIARPRLEGHTCFWINSAESLKLLEKVGKASVSNTECWLPFSPHNYIEFISFGQLLLWLVLAANLPTIMRKRG